jgi:hypothetical protein
MTLIGDISFALDRLIQFPEGDDGEEEDPDD